jgi:hypothetical protein
MGSMGSSTIGDNDRHHGLGVLPLYPSSRVAIPDNLTVFADWDQAADNGPSGAV